MFARRHVAQDPPWVDRVHTRRAIPIGLVFAVERSRDAGSKSGYPVRRTDLAPATSL
jgi:hypothetical protein